MKATDKRTQIALDSYLVDTVHDAEAAWDGDPAFALIGALALPERPARTARAPMESGATPPTALARRAP
jgi:hypothetical protein